MPLTRPPVFVTGGTGFIGRHVIAALVQAGDRRLRCLTRAGVATAGHANIEAIQGELEKPESYLESLQGAAVVLHLAAKTGKGRQSDYMRTNLEGTRSLLRACRQAGVARFVYVSSIAATFQDKTAYHYAESKWQAEQAVRASGLTYLIVRPTLVFGHGSATWNNLVLLARLPVIPVLGGGLVRVQPIYVDDVAAYLVSMLDESLLPNRAVDLGGPDVVSMEELLRRIHRARRGREAAVIHVPVRRAIQILAWMERWAGSLLPVTAGQLAAFVNDSTARPDPSVADRLPRMTSLDAMLERLVNE
jgi:nucleoside-diphosphate-sugar epimerase